MNIIDKIIYEFKDIKPKTEKAIISEEDYYDYD